MANDGGVWARLPQPNNGGGIWTKTSSGWVEIGGGGSDGLEGLGGWAEINSVTGSPKRYAYNDGSMDWVAFEWEGDGEGKSSAISITEGLLDFLVISGGSGAGGDVASAGRLQRGMRHFPNPNVDVVACGPGTSLTRQSTRLGDVISPPVGASQNAQDTRGAGATDAATSTNRMQGYTDSITGDPVVYGTAGNNSDSWGSAGKPGVVIVRVPAAQAAGVDPGSWVTRIDYYAEVTDGIVTDTYQERFYGDDSVRTENGRYASPEQPDDLIPCDPSVAEGWTYADGEFTPPPPDPSWREEAIEALKQQIKDLQKDT